MILGVGTDILDISRIKIEHANRVLSLEELEIFNNFKLDTRKIEYLAGRFCVKEAIIKAIGNTDYSIGMRDITILNDEKGKPILIKPTFDDIAIHISLSHEKSYCVGFCLIENV